MTDTEILNMVKQMAEAGQQREWIHAESVLQLIDMGRETQGE